MVKVQRGSYYTSQLYTGYKTLPTSYDVSAFFDNPNVDFELSELASVTILFTGLS
jgi:hypothetical protein